MKTLKNFIVIIALAILSNSVNAQAQFGLKAGLNIANQKYTQSGYSVTPSSLMGFHVGAIAEFSVSDNFAIQPGLLFSQKGAKMDVLGETAKDVFNYLDIPINLMLKFDAGSMKVFGQAGPVISYALSGKSTFDGESEDIEFGTDAYKRLDIGLGFGAGVQFSSVQVSVSYTLGMANIVDSSDATVKNNVIGISVAYLFGDN